MGMVRRGAMGVRSRLVLPLVLVHAETVLDLVDGGGGVGLLVILLAADLVTEGLGGGLLRVGDNVAGGL